MSEVKSLQRAFLLKFQYLIGLLLLAVLVLLVWRLWTAGRAPAEDVDIAPVPVRVARVTRQDFPIVLKVLGTVTAYNTANVRSRVDGELVAILFKDGQPVKSGDVLAQIDPRPFQIALQQAQGTLQENQALLKNAENDLRVYRGLFAEDSIARQTLDTQQALVNQYRGTLQNNQAAVDEARLNLEFTQVRAPIDGRLGIRQVDKGNLLNTSDTTPIVVITQTLPIAVSFALPEQELPAVLEQVRAGRPLPVQAWDRDELKQLAVGELESLDNQIDTTTGTVKLKARFENADETLFPNQFVNVHLQVAVREQAALMPVAALQAGANGPFVYVVDAANKVQVRPLKLGPGNAEFNLVEEGVSAGEQVVIEGTDRLRSGSSVEVINPQEPSDGPQALPEQAAGLSSPS
jgi:multidrug efflux system membrane fusion protein